MRDATDTAVIDGSSGTWVSPWAMGIATGWDESEPHAMGGECSIEEECQEKSAVQCESPDTRERGACRYLDGVPNCQQRVLCMMFVETALSAKGLVVPLRSPW